MLDGAEGMLGFELIFDNWFIILSCTEVFFVNHLDTPSFIVISDIFAVRKYSDNMSFMVKNLIVFVIVNFVENHNAYSKSILLQ